MSDQQGKPTARDGQQQPRSRVPGAVDGWEVRQRGGDFEIVVRDRPAQRAPQRRAAAR